MNITTSQLWPNPSAQTPSVRISKEHDSGAFQMTLRSMEKDMWTGEESGVSDERRPPIQPSRSGPTQNHARAVPLTARAVSMTATNTSSEFVNAPAGRIPVFTANGYSSSPATSLDTDKSLRQVSKSAMSEVQTGFSEVTDDPILDPHSAPEPAAPMQGTQRVVTRTFAHTPAGAVLASSSADGAAAYRLNVVIEGSGISIALRIRGATSDDLAQLKEKALAEARRYGGRDVRLVVNGIDQITTSLRGASNGY